MPDPITPISDEDMSILREWAENRGAVWPGILVLALLARLDAQTATIKHFTGWLKEADARAEKAEVAPHAVLASPEGVVTLDGGEADRPKAAQVLAATALGWVLGHGGHQPSEDGSDLYDAQQADLLAHGSEYGVAILADGSLRPLTDPAYQPEDQHG